LEVEQIGLKMTNNVQTYDQATQSHTDQHHSNDEDRQGRGAQRMVIIIAITPTHETTSSHEVKENKRAKLFYPFFLVDGEDSFFRSFET
jgi:hypothetical protein